jgi:hypothetical protein
MSARAARKRLPRPLLDAKPEGSGSFNTVFSTTDPGTVYRRSNKPDKAFKKNSAIVNLIGATPELKSLCIEYKSALQLDAAGHSFAFVQRAKPVERVTSDQVANFVSPLLPT